MEDMKVLIAGAGPAGLYLAYLLKRQLPAWQVRVVEQNARDSTFGFGVVFSERALEFLRADDAETYERITPEMEAWTDITVVLRGTPVVIDGIGFSAIGRLKFLQLLRAQLEAAGVPSVQVHVAGLCTSTYPEVLCSYRRDGTRAGRLAGVIRARKV